MAANIPGADKPTLRMLPWTISPRSPPDLVEETVVSLITNDQHIEEVAESVASKAAAHSTQMLMNLFKQTAATGGCTSDAIANFIGFGHRQYASSDQAFNLANLGIAQNILLLDSQSTIHLISNPALLSNI